MWFGNKYYKPIFVSVRNNQPLHLPCSPDLVSSRDCLAHPTGFWSESVFRPREISRGETHPVNNLALKQATAMDNSPLFRTSFPRAASTFLQDSENSWEFDVLEASLNMSD